MNIEGGTIRPSRLADIGALEEEKRIKLGAIPAQPSEKREKTTGGYRGFGKIKRLHKLKSEMA